MNKIRLLLIDDDEDDYLITRDLLDDIGTLNYHLDWTDSPAEARKILSRNEHDLCLLDYELGIEDGVTLLKQAADLGFSAPVIMLTGQDNEQLDKQAQQAGAVDYLVKNQLNAARLARAIRYAISRQEMERERMERIKAETDNRYKSEFLAHLSHELRTPLTAILGYTDLISGQVQNQSVLDNLQVVKRNGNHLLSLLNDVLDLSKIEAGKLELENACFSLTPFIEDISNLMRVYALDKGIEFRLTLDADVPPLAYTDPTRLRQVLLNLLNNAIKFTSQGQVTLEVASTNGRDIDFTVSDTGIGIAPDDLADLFKPFTQARSNRDQAAQGTGLGLAICQKLVDKLEGNIEVTSEPGKGSRFSVQLPCGRHQPPKGVSRQDIETADLTSEAKITLKGRVLITDDLEDIRRLIGQLVSATGADIAYAVDGQDAIARFREARDSDQPFDLLIMDVQMPGMSGIETTRQIRTMDSRVPIVALTAALMKGDKEKGLEAGVNEYLGKPVHAIQLIRTLAHYLSPPGKPGSTPQSVLLVEDNDDAREVTASIIEHLGFAVTTAASAEQALASFRESEPAQVLLDIHLPDGNGFELADKMKAIHPGCRIIALSGEQLSKEQLADSGFDGFELKPVNLQTLNALLNAS